MLTRNLLTFTRALRRLGVPVSIDQQRTLVRALEEVDLLDGLQVRSTLRAVLATRREEARLVDELFERLLLSAGPRTPIRLGKLLRPTARRRPRSIAHPLPTPADNEAPDVDTDHVDPHRRASAVERLRTTDFARLTDDERRTVVRWLVDHPLRLRPRRVRRWRGDTTGPRIDLRATLRRAARRGGEPVEILRRRRRTKPRPLVALCDVSGSMEVYARVLLPFLWTLRATGADTEVFAFGTRLTRLTHRLTRRDPDAALRDAAAAIVDWGGGTRIGESLRTFHRRWGQLILRRGAVVLVLSDAWDRGDPDLLERQVARLGRSCHRLIWLNPLLGGAGYEPVASGVRAVLPHIDDFLPVHDLASLERLGTVIRRLA